MIRYNEQKAPFKHFHEYEPYLRQCITDDANKPIKDKLTFSVVTRTDDHQHIQYNEVRLSGAGLTYPLLTIGLSGLIHQCGIAMVTTCRISLGFRPNINLYSKSALLGITLLWLEQELSDLKYGMMMATDTTSRCKFNRKVSDILGYTITSPVTNPNSGNSIQIYTKVINHGQNADGCPLIKKFLEMAKPRNPPKVITTVKPDVEPAVITPTLSSYMETGRPTAPPIPPQRSDYRHWVESNIWR